MAKNAHMLAALAFSILPQRIDPLEEVSYSGDEVAVRAIDRAGRSLRGLEIRVESPSGQVATCRSDGDGVARFAASEVGIFELRARPPGGPLVLAVHRVVAPPRRLLWALVLTPLGIGLVVLNLRRWRHRS